MFETIRVYAFVGPSGTGKSYRAQMVASEKNVNYIIDDGLLIKDNEVIAGESAKKAPTKIETVKHALFYTDEEKQEIIKDYEDKFSNPYCAAERGLIDEVIMPRDTRYKLIQALEMCHNKNQSNPPKKHGNMPL